MEKQKYTKYFTSCKGVFQGGGCKAIAYIGAYKKAYERGVFFSELAGTSAGAIIAALIAAGAKPDYLENMVNELDFKDFISEYTKPNWLNRMLIKKIIPKEYNKYAKYISKRGILENYGIFDSSRIETFVGDQLRKLTGLNRDVTFKDLIPDLHIVCADLESHGVKIWNKKNTPEDSVAKAVRCSCSIPLFFQPVDKKYVDGGVLSNLPNFIFAEEPHYNRILCFKLVSDNSRDKIQTVAGFTSSLIDTIVEGANGIQQKLNTESFEVSISTNKISSIDFDKLKDKAVITKLIKNGEESMDHFLNDESTFSYPNSNHASRILATKEQMRSLVSYISLEHHKEIYVSGDNTNWCWELFLSIVRSINNGTKITVFTSSAIQPKFDEEERARRRMLEAMGCNVIVKDQLSVYGYFFMDKNIWKGIIYREGKESEFNAKYYNHEIDSDLIKGFGAKFSEELSSIPPTPDLPDTGKITIRSVKEELILEKLKTEPIYANAELSFETLELTDLLFMNPYIRALKYKQIDELFQLYDEEKLPPFSPAALLFKNNKESLIGPPVVEEHNNKYYIIEGNTRCVYAYKHGLTKLQAVVIRKVTEPIPCDTQKTYIISNILISDKNLVAGKRYTDFNYKQFRHIEECIRPYKSYML